ncbi:hypothetical protein [Larkinella soli]|uniref:hypothetical protein n=1 Tax=Larkinella soli TaxID=1770527 RepID=UPI000FFB8576|nr:hypothetical protein [Larkinella soli]
MKTSDKLLLTLLFLTLSALTAVTMGLKASYNRIDFKDPMFSYDPHPIPAFRVLKLNGDNSRYLILRSGDQPSLRVRKVDIGNVSYRTIGDTLVVSVRNEEPYYRLKAGEFSGPPIGYLVLPKLETLVLTNANSRIDDLKTDALTVYLEKSGLYIFNSRIATLTATAVLGSKLETTGQGQSIGQASVTVQDSGTFKVSGNSIRTLQLLADSATVVQLPGALLRRITP